MIRAGIAILAALALAIIAGFHSHTTQAHTCPPLPRLEKWRDWADTIFVGEVVSVRPEWTAHRPLADLRQGILPELLHGRLWVFDMAYIVEFKVSSVLAGQAQETAYYKLLRWETYEIDAEEGILLYPYFYIYQVGTEYLVYAKNGWVNPTLDACRGYFTPQQYARYYEQYVEFKPSRRETAPALEDGVAPLPGSVDPIPVIPLPHRALPTNRMPPDASSYYTPSVDFHGDTYGESAVVKHCCTDEELKRLWQGIPISTAASAH